MICYLVRHGKDDETVRGGWSAQPLTEEGIEQAQQLAVQSASLPIGKLYSSDLRRAMETAKLLANKLQLTVIPLPQFREVNNGDLAGMKNDMALVNYPGLFWNQLEWEENYPGGESPKEFYERIAIAWNDFSEEILSQNNNVMLVTHTGVIHVILSIIEGRVYSNKEKQRKISYAEVIELSYENNKWNERN